MKKFIVFALAFALVFFAVGCGKKSAKPGDEGVMKGATVEEFQTTIEEMIKTGKPYKCDYKMSFEGINQEGVLYFGGKDLARGDIEVTIPGQGAMKTYFIKDGDVQYIWTDQQERGMKMTITEEELKEMQDAAGEIDSQGFDMTSKIDLKCVKWSPSATTFKPPSNIQFDDMTEMIKGFEASMNSDSGSFNFDESDLCFVCAQLPAGPDRDICEKEYCN